MPPFEIVIFWSFAAGSLLTTLYFVRRLYTAYMKTRLHGFEDRFMQLYGKDDWEMSNMELVVSFPVEQDKYVKHAFCKRLSNLLGKRCKKTSLLSEEVVFEENGGMHFIQKKDIRVSDLIEPRRGVYFDFHQPGKIRLVWSHIQADGLRVWREVRPLFDTNPEILTFNGIKPPIPFLPELLSIPNTVKNAFLRSKLTPPQQKLQKQFKVWSTAPMRDYKSFVKGSFNLVTSAFLLEELFHRHPETNKLMTALTVAFPFLEAKNQYGLVTCEIERGSIHHIYQQLEKKINHPIVIWGNFSNQSNFLSCLPNEQFMKVIKFFRGQIDVLISNLPVGQNPIRLADTPIEIACHTDELTIPYYFLLLGTKKEIHLSCTTKYTQESTFLCQDRQLERIEGVPSISTTLQPIPS